jgi:hypothetical protein
MLKKFAAFMHTKAEEEIQDLDDEDRESISQEGSPSADEVQEAQSAEVQSAETATAVESNVESNEVESSEDLDVEDSE